VPSAPPTSRAYGCFDATGVTS